MTTLTTRVLQNGERAPFLLDTRGLPLFYPTLYATSQLRNAGAAVNTIKNKLADIVALLRWESINRRNLIDEFQHGSFLGLVDIMSLRDFMQRNMRDIDNPARAARKVQLNGFLEAHIRFVRPARIVGVQQHYNRMTTAADYLAFVASVVTSHKHSASDSVAIVRMRELIKRHRPRNIAKLTGDDALAKSPPSKLVERFMAVAGVNHPKNPFRNPDVRLRNAIIFGLLRHTGMRRGEVLSLRTDQIQLGEEPIVWIRRNQDDRCDARPYQPVAKTKERSLPIPRDLADEIQDYVTRVRATVRPARIHPYLLISHKKGKTYGRALSQSAFGSEIMSAMRSVDPAFAAIHPHAFRHHFNYELSERFDADNVEARKHPGDPRFDPVSPAQELDIRAYVNGHRNKQSGAVYNQRHVQERADVAVRQLQIKMPCVKEVTP